MEEEAEDPVIPVEPISVLVQNGTGYVWSSDDAIALRSQFRMMGGMVSSISGFKQQNHIRGPPLQLCPEEVTLLLEQGVIRLSAIKVEAPGSLRRKRALPDSSDDESIPEDWTGLNFTPSWQVAVEQQVALSVTDKHASTPTTSPPWNYPESLRDRQYYTVFKDLHDKGYFLTSGIKFGADYLAYEEDPELCHSTFAVKVVPGGLVDEFDLGASCRAATGARKRLLIADPVQEDGHWVVNYTTVAFERTVYFQAA